MTRTLASDIDQGAGHMIIDRVEIPNGDHCKGSTLNHVLCKIKSLAVPGGIIKADREKIRRRTQLSLRTVNDAIKDLQTLKILEQISSPGPGKPAQFRINYKLILQEFLPDEDLEEVVDIFGSELNRRSKRRSTQAAAAHVAPSTSDGTQAATAHVADSTQAAASTRVGSDCMEDEKQLHGKQEVASDQICRNKEERARRAIPAPPATEEIDRWLLNLASGGGAGGVGVMDEDAWLRLSEFAGLKRDGIDPKIRRDCAGILTNRGVLDAETGLAAMEKLGDRMLGRGVNSAMGMFCSFLDPEKDKTGECERTRKRKQREQQAMHATRLKIENQWSEQMQQQVFTRMKRILETHIGRENATHVIQEWHRRDGVLEWDAMIALISSAYDVLTKAEAVSA